MELTEKKALSSHPSELPNAGPDLEPALREIIRAIRGISFGSVEIVIHNSRVVQIERKEKLRFDRG